MAEAHTLQLRDTISLIKADLGSVCVQSAWKPVGIPSLTPTEPLTIASARASARES